MRLSRQDIEFIWTELAIYLHIVLIAVFLFIALYAWRLDKTLAFIIFGCDIVILFSTVSALVRRHRLTRAKNPYMSKEYACETTDFIGDMLENKESPEMIAKVVCEQSKEAYARGYLDGRRH